MTKLSEEAQLTRFERILLAAMLSFIATAFFVLILLCSFDVMDFPDPRIVLLLPFLTTFIIAYYFAREIKAWLFESV